MMAVAARVPEHWLRPALSGDVDAMATLVNGYAARGLMLPKTPEALRATLADHVVVVDREGRLRACGGLRVYGPGSAEIVALAVVEDARGEGLGGLVVDHLVRRARRLRIRRVFAMTLGERFFLRHGFERVERASLPEKEQADCATCPRREGCPEIAVARTLPAPRKARRRAPTRVLPMVGATAG